MEDACTKLDVMLAEANHGKGGVGGSTFIQYSIVLQQRSSLKEQLDSQMVHATLLEQLTTYLALSLMDAETNEPLHAMRNEAAVARSRAQEMVIIY